MILLQENIFPYIYAYQSYPSGKATLVWTQSCPPPNPVHPPTHTNPNARVVPHLAQTRVLPWWVKIGDSNSTRWFSFIAGAAWMLLPGDLKMHDCVINCQMNGTGWIWRQSHGCTGELSPFPMTLSPLSNCPIQNASGEDNQKNKADVQLWLADTGHREGNHTRAWLFGSRSLCLGPDLVLPFCNWYWELRNSSILLPMAPAGLPSLGRRDLEAFRSSTDLCTDDHCSKILQAQKWPKKGNVKYII